MTDRAIRDVVGLARSGLIAPERVADLARVETRYAVALTGAVVDLVDASDPADPIAAQFVPDVSELETLPDESADPIGDRTHSPVDGVVHRYPDRVLLKLLHACPVYCRFCFRREMVGPGGDHVLSPAALDAAIAYIRSDPRIWEAILTGGDPLGLSPRRLADALGRLADVDHLRTLRIHTRVPLVAPERVTSELIAALRKAGKPVWIALHANHPREFAPAGRAALARLVEAGFPMVSQTVLLRGVNDDAQTLAELMRVFVENRVKPYYLHHLDRAPGTARFRVPVEEGLALVRSLRGRLSGLAQPEYVLDIPGGYGKAPLGPIYLRAEEAGASIEDWRGGRHRLDDETAMPARAVSVRDDEVRIRESSDDASSD